MEEDEAILTYNGILPNYITGGLHSQTPLCASVWHTLENYTSAEDGVCDI